jgi:hypothetical protein
MEFLLYPGFSDWFSDEFHVRRTSTLISRSAHQEATTMAGESVSATATINVPAEAIFAVLADPVKHAAIDGTGWVREPVDSQPLTAAGQVFRMAMYHPGHPDRNYQMATAVQRVAGLASALVRGAQT